MTDFIFDGPEDATAMFVLTHGSGSGMDTHFMNVIAEGVATNAICVARFEFAYMAARRSGGSRKPPPTCG